MSGSVHVIETRSEEETARVAATLAAGLPFGSVILLTGDLGAGKTAFVRGVAIGLGLDPDEVSSPTFTLVQEYRGAGRLTLHHVDLYRLESAEAEDLGLEELAAGGGVVAIEWAEKLSRPVPGATRVEIVDRGDDRREIRISG
jgi:tRNA threonylcarbamoyladenosine biosynthesis protein TsaE